MPPALSPGGWFSRTVRSSGSSVRAGAVDVGAAAEFVEHARWPCEAYRRVMTTLAGGAAVLVDRAVMAMNARSDDVQESMRAFREKREPRRRDR
jgi:hypothetical protein